MATFNTSQYTQQLQAVNGFGGRPLSANVSGLLMFLVATYTTTGSEANNDLINIGILPEGVVVMPDQCRVSTDGVGGTGSTVATLGDILDDDRYSATSIAIVNAGSTAFTPVNAQVVTPVGVPEGGTAIMAKLGLSSGSYTAGKKITFRIAYRSVV